MDTRLHSSGRSERYAPDDDESDGSQAVSAPTEHDRAVLEDEEQQEKLLTGSAGRSSSNSANNELAFHQRERARRKGHRRLGRRMKLEEGNTDEEGKLMYEMEEGSSRNNLSSSSSSSLELEEKEYQSPRKAKVSANIRLIRITSS